MARGRSRDTIFWADPRASWKDWNLSTQRIQHHEFQTYYLSNRSQRGASSLYRLVDRNVFLIWPDETRSCWAKKWILWIMYCGRWTDWSKQTCNGNTATRKPTLQEGSGTKQQGPWPSSLPHSRPKGGYSRIRIVPSLMTGAHTAIPLLIGLPTQLPIWWSERSNNDWETIWSSPHIFCSTEVTGRLFASDRMWFTMIPTYHRAGSWAQTARPWHGTRRRSGFQPITGTSLWRLDSVPVMEVQQSSLTTL